MTGKITDANSGNPLSFATVAIYKSPEQLVEGNITDDKGEFTIDIPFGTYYALIEFMGFEPFKSPEFQVSKEQPVYRFESLKLNPTMSNLSEVVVEGEKAFMELALDKRVFNVGEDLANAGSRKHAWRATTNKNTMNGPPPNEG